MFRLDPQTLSLAIGLSNLAFALLASLYLAGTPRPNRALDLWRWARLCTGAGFLLNLLQHAAPTLMPPVVGNSLHIVALAMELTAYRMLLERRPMHGFVAAYAAAAAALLWGLFWLGATEKWRLLLVSLVAFTFYAAMAVMLLRDSPGQRLAHVIGWMDAILALTLVLRVGNGYLVATFVRYQPDWATQSFYLAALLVSVVNGIGFLLLAKQKDDARLRRMLDELTQAKADQRMLLSAASHEFRTPAARIRASLDSLALMAVAAPPEVARRLDNIRAAATRLTELADTLITQDRLDGQFLAPDRTRFDLAEWAARAVAGHEAGAVARGAWLDEALPILADATLLSLALNNLIDNALEHGRADRGPVEVSLRRLGERVEIAVADRGPGIPDADKPLVFRRYHNSRGHLARGLGLHIVATVAQSHGGRVEVRDNPSGGAVFCLDLPLDGGDGAGS